MKIKSTLLTIALIFAVSPLFAQAMGDYLEVARGVLQTEKKAAVAEVMILTETESAPFWEFYNAYNAELYKVHTKRVDVIMEYAKNLATINDTRADELWTNVLSYQTELTKLNKTYYKKLKKILPAGKAAMYFQVENKIAALINAELALEVPLLEINPMLKN